MQSLLLQSKSKKELEIIEKMGLANAMKSGHTGKYVDTTAYLKKLKGETA